MGLWQAGAIGFHGMRCASKSASLAEPLKMEHNFLQYIGIKWNGGRTSEERVWGLRDFCWFCSH